jgi:CDP-glucose 4,6-dehydratase
VKEAVRSFWHERAVLVTGATGLVGGWLVRALVESGSRVVCLVRDSEPHCELVRSGLVREVSTAQGDITDQATVERVLGEYEVDTVFHLAAQTIVGTANANPVATLDTNIRGTWTVLEACRRSPRVKQVVVASSDKAYGAQPVLPYDESAPLQGLYPYDVSKSCADLLARSYAATYGLPVVITRCGNFYGGGDLHWNRIVPGTIRSVLRGERPVIRSDGQFVRDYLYVEDGAAAYLLLAEQLARRPELAGEAFNFSYELRLTVLELVHRILALMGSDLQPEVRNEVSHEIREQFLSTAKARRELGWQPQHHLDEGLARTIAWYRAFLAP